MIRLIMDFFTISYLSLTDGCVSVLAMVRFINGFLNFFIPFSCVSQLAMMDSVMRNYLFPLLLTWL